MQPLNKHLISKPWRIRRSLLILVSFSKTQKGEKRHELITSVLFQSPHEHIVQEK